MNTIVSASQDRKSTRFAPTPHATSACIAIIWLKGGDKISLQESLLEELKQARGVEDASFSPSRAHVIVVRYKHGTTQAGEVLQKIRQHGYEAVLVGC